VLAALAAALLVCAVSPVRAAAADPAGMRSERIETPVFGGEAVIYEAGPREARSVLLVHGIGNDGARDFAGEVEWLARDYHVVTFDLPGFGRSDKANAPYTPANFVAFVKSVVDRYTRGPVVLIGHSMGGLIALRYAATYPGDVERLVVADVPGVLHRLSFTSQLIARRAGEWFPDFLRPVERIEAWARKFLGRAERKTELDAQALLADADQRESYFNGQPAKIAGFALTMEDPSGWLPAVSVPTLIVWGRDDDVAPLRTGRLLALRLPQARLAVLDGVGHTPMEDDPKALRATIEPFVRAGDWPPGAETAPAPPATSPRQAAARCERDHHVTYDGNYDVLVINRCRHVRVRNARVRELRVLHSTVEIDNSVIGDGERALFARSSTVTVTGGRLEAAVAITALGSRLDLAGVEVVASRAIAQAPVASSLVFSLCRFDSPAGRRDVHDFFAVTPAQPLR
jgi:pimeloyl-ACP methyl ester carboxylesterase